MKIKFGFFTILFMFGLTTGAANPISEDITDAKSLLCTKRDKSGSFMIELTSQNPKTGKYEVQPMKAKSKDGLVKVEIKPEDIAKGELKTVRVSIEGEEFFPLNLEKRISHRNYEPGQDQKIAICTVISPRAAAINIARQNSALKRNMLGTSEPEDLTKASGAVPVAQNTQTTKGTLLDVAVRERKAQEGYIEYLDPEKKSSLSPSRPEKTSGTDSH